MVKILFTADLHGNKKQYKLLLENSSKYDIVIIGGDLTPKDPGNRTIIKQREFIQEFLNPILSKITSTVIVLMGNDDFKFNETVIEKSSNILYSSKGIISAKGIDFVCYSYVPLTPFKYKDWERVEFDGILEHNNEREFVLEGFVSETGELTPHTIPLNMSDSIYSDLSSKVTPNSILISHAPPKNTFADTISNNIHVGSKAIRTVIEEKQPLLSLHGHIHESVDITGKYLDTIGVTKVCSVGNYHTTQYLYALEITIEEEISVKRVKFETDKIVL